MLAVIEIAASVKSFINIDLPAQGWYAIGVSIPADAGLTACWPASVTELLLGNRPPPEQRWRITAGGFRTQMFKIQFSCEEVDISETFVFHLYADATAPATIDGLSCTLDVALYVHEADVHNPASVPATFNLRPVAKEELRVSGVATCVLEHYSCTFSPQHFCLANLGIISTLQGYTTMQALRHALKAAQVAGYPGCLDCWLGMRQSPSQLAQALHGPSMASKPSDACATTHAQSQQGLSSYSQVLVLPDNLHQSSMLTALLAAVNAGMGNRPICHKFKAFSNTASANAPASPDMLTEVAQLYDLLVGTQQQTHSRLVAFLEALPNACFGPQSYSAIRALMKNAVSLQSPATAAAGTAELSLESWPCRGDPALFLQQLPQNSTLDAAIQHLMAGLEWQRQEVMVDWHVLIWVLAASPLDLHRWLKCRWGMQQPTLIEHWLSVDARGLSLKAKAALAASLRKRMRASDWSMELPKVRNRWFYEQAARHPVLMVDDSMAQHLHAVSEPGTPGHALPSAPSQSLPVAASVEAPTRHASPSPLALSDVNLLHHSIVGREKPQQHFMIFVHGFQGCSTDLRLVRGHLAMLFPYLECYSSTANEGCTSDSIHEMGARLAREIAELLSPHLRSTRRPLVAVSFVGHSIGNLILRSALTCPEMQPYLRMLHLYISICGPHLGYLFSSNLMLDAGVAVLQAFTSKGQCLQQLSFTDAPDVKDCYLYSLAHQSCLAGFKHVMLVSSAQDRYVPYHSSCISMCQAAAQDAKHGPAYETMVKKLLEGIGQAGGAQLLRVDVAFHLHSKPFSLRSMVDNCIGRHAHVEFLENDIFARFLAWTVHRYSLLRQVDHAWL